MSHRQSIEALVLAHVPLSRDDDALKNELVAHCEDVLNSRIGLGHEPDFGHVADIAKRKLMQLNPSGSSALNFTNLLSRLLDEPVLTRKQASVQFLQALSSSPRPTATRNLLPSVVPPPPTRSSAPNPRRSVSPIPPDSSKPALATTKTKAELLKGWRIKTGHSHLSETLLLRDTLYLMQGISGRYVQFAHDANENGEEKRLIFVEDSKHNIPVRTQALIHRLAEVGYLYTRVENFVQEREGSAGVGMIEQSLCHHLHTQLTEYYRLIAVLESQMTMSQGQESNPREEETGLTLRRLDVWITDWKLRMRMMSVCVEGARDTHGGALVNLIHSYTDNGDPFVRKFTDQLLEEVSKPFFSILHKWLFSGELYDPFSEFFVAMDEQISGGRYMHPSALSGDVGQLSQDGGFGGGDDDDERDGQKLWEAKYQFQHDMLPLFVGETFGKKIFSTGKSLNFIRYSCHDSDWVATREKMTSTGGILKYSDIAGLERSIDAAYHVASQRLFEVFIDKFKLLDHLAALKGYLLLWHGDFADHLMEALGPSLSRPANTLFRHNLTATLETAIRSSNAQHDPPYVLSRLDARMLEYSHGEIGWDVFTLEYKIDAPINTVIDSDCVVKYLKLFNHLWQLKRVETILTKAWMRLAGGRRSLLRVPELESEWHRVRTTMSEMIHFVRQMQAYCNLEVIECSWKVLLDFFEKKEGDLDAMIEAHRTYLDRMVKKILLVIPKAGKQENLLNLVKEAFSFIISFHEASENFYNHCLTESARRDRELDTQRGVYTGGEASASDPEMLPRVLQPLREYGNSFSERAQTIVHQLQSHPDLDCRFLGIRLSFSDFYRIKREQQLQQQKEQQQQQS